MGSKIFIGVLCLIVAAVSVIPGYLSYKASGAFLNVKDPEASDDVKNYLMMNMLLSINGTARETAEKAIIYFPESKNFDYFLLSAAKAAEKSQNTEAALHWYSRFAKDFPRHESCPAAREKILKISEQKQRKQ